MDKLEFISNIALLSIFILLIASSIKGFYSYIIFYESSSMLGLSLFIVPLVVAGIIYAICKEQWLDFFKELKNKDTP